MDSSAGGVAEEKKYPLPFQNVAEAFVLKRKWVPNRANIPPTL